MWVRFAVRRQWIFCRPGIPVMTEVLEPHMPTVPEI